MMFEQFVSQEIAELSDITLSGGICGRKTDNIARGRFADSRMEHHDRLWALKPRRIDQILHRTH